jgi:V/A-type H+/Na+-transporting ATPase subunit C
MDAKYLYSAARARTLESELLTDSQVESLIGAKLGEETMQILQNTFLSPYIVDNKDTDVNKIMASSLEDTKKLISAMAPDSESLKILWLRYDFLNLKTIIKGKRVGLSDEDILLNCISLGNRSPHRLLKALNDNTLKSVDPVLFAAYEEASAEDEAYLIEGRIIRHYFNSIRQVMLSTKSTFLKGFLHRLIDIYNLTTALRATRMKEMVVKEDLFEEGGTFKPSDLETEETILESFKKIGNRAVWDDAIAAFVSEGNFAALEKAADESILNYIKDESREMFSLATLYGFFLAKRNDVRTIRAILTAKEGGLAEKDIRSVIRRKYSFS